MNILAFFAHPDDETMLAGGMLALLARQGAAVHYLCATRGEGGESGDPPVCELDELGAVREQELVCAVRVLGGRSLTFLGYIDPRVGPDDRLFPYASDLTLLAGQLATTLRQFNIQAMITHGSNGEYGHPAHVLSNQAARIAVESMGAEAPHLYTISAAFDAHPRPRLANRDDLAHWVVDITHALEQKTRAAFCHLSQNALFVRRSSQEAGRTLTIPEVILRTESLHRAYPAVAGAPDVDGDSLGSLLQPWLIQPV